MTLATVALTAYCLADGTGRTATGALPLAHYTAAADWRVYPPGTVLLVLGHGVRVVEDRGSKVRGAHLDLYVGEDCREAKRFGRTTGEVLVLQEGRADRGRLRDVHESRAVPVADTHGEPLIEASPSGARADLRDPRARSAEELRGADRRHGDWPARGPVRPHASISGGDAGIPPAGLSAVEGSGRAIFALSLVSCPAGVTSPAGRSRGDR